MTTSPTYPQNPQTFPQALCGKVSSETGAKPFRKTFPQPLRVLRIADRSAMPQSGNAEVRLSANLSANNHWTYPQPVAPLAGRRAGIGPQ